MTGPGPSGRLRRMGGRVLRGARNAWDRLRHPSRHRAAIERARAAGRVRSILVVCHGNICRSPYLAAVLSQELPQVEVSSAGFIGAGRTVPEHSLTVAARRGLELRGHRSQLLSRDRVSGADLIVVMDSRQAAALTAGFAATRERVIIAGDLEAEFGTARAIEDPWHKPLGAFEAAFARLDRCARVLVTAITSTAGRS